DPRRKRGNVKKFLFANFRFGDFLLRTAAHYVKLAFQLILRHSSRATDENLLDIRLRSPGVAADGIGIHRRVAPAEHRESLFLRHALDNALAHQPLLRLDRQEHHANAVGPRLGQAEAESGTFAIEKLVRDFDKDARAVTSFRVAAARTTVREI